MHDGGDLFAILWTFFFNLLPNTDMANFFEVDTDEYDFKGRTYVDYFNLYPNLWQEPTLEHLQSLDVVTVLDYLETESGWQIGVRFCDYLFLLDTHYHGTSTMFCFEKGFTDKKVMLAFLGCFLPVIRDDWPCPAEVKKKRPGCLAGFGSWLSGNNVY